MRQYDPDWPFTERDIEKEHGPLPRGLSPQDSVRVAGETIKKKTSGALREKVRSVQWHCGARRRGTCTA